GRGLRGAVGGRGPLRGAAKAPDRGRVSACLRDDDRAVRRGRRIDQERAMTNSENAVLDNERLVWMFTQMLRIREFEERVKRTFEEHPGVIRGHTHLADGAEGSIVG